MKKLCLAAGIALFAIFAGCTTAPALPTLQQQFVQMCPVVTADLKVLAASPLLTATQQQAFNGVPGDPTKPGIIAVNTTICSSGAALNVTNLKAFHDSLLPIAIGIVQATPAIPNQPLVLLALQLFGPVVQGLVDQAIATVAPVVSTPLTGAPIAPASAPVAASAAVVA